MEKLYGVFQAEGRTALGNYSSLLPSLLSFGYSSHSPRVALIMGSSVDLMAKSQNREQNKLLKETVANSPESPVCKMEPLSTEYARGSPRGEFSVEGTLAYYCDMFLHNLHFTWI